MTCENCLVCSTPNKIKGLIFSGLLVGCAITTSALTFTTDCQRVIHFSNNQTQTVNDIGTANKVMSVSLLAFSVASALFERYINKRLLDLADENDGLKTEIYNLSQNNRSRNFENEPLNILATPSPITPYPDETTRSSETHYPAPLNFRR